MGLLYNVTAFMRPGQPIEVKSKPSSAGGDRWPILIKIGPGGEDTIDIHTDIENATRLRDALTAALAAAAEPAEAKIFRCTCCTFPQIGPERMVGHAYSITSNVGE